MEDRGQFEVCRSWSPARSPWSTIEKDVKRLFDHPVWTEDLTRTEKLAAVQDALSKNQGVEGAFAAVGLKLGYVVGADAFDPDCIEDR